MRGTIRKRGKNYYYTLDLPKVDGKRRQIERFGGLTYVDAENALRKAINELRDTGRYKDVSNISVRDFFEYWYENYVMTNLKYNTQQNYRMVIDKHILPYLDKYYLREVDPSVLQNLVHEEFRKGYAQKTISIVTSVLKNAFRKAVYPYMFLKENPMAYVESPRLEKRKLSKDEMKIINREDWSKLRMAIPEASAFYIPMMIAYYTGMRRGEVSALEWKNVDMEDKIIHVEATMIHKGGEIAVTSPKTASSYRDIPFGEVLYGILRKHQKQQKENRLRYGPFYKESNFVCTKEDGAPVTPNSIKWHVGKAREISGVDFNFHSFRHTHGTMLLENGATIKEVQVRLGHSRAAITSDTYIHLTKKKKRDTAELFDRISQDF